MQTLKAGDPARLHEQLPADIRILATAIYVCCCALLWGWRSRRTLATRHRLVFWPPASARDLLPPHARSPARPWQRPGFGSTLRHGDPGAAPPPIPTHPGPYTRLGRLPARLPTASAHHYATLSGGPAPPRDVPLPGHRDRSHGLRCPIVGGEGPEGPRFARCPLRCGILAHGFARVRCDDCGHERLLAFGAFSSRLRRSGPTAPSARGGVSNS